MRILVSGGAGFVGRNLAKAFAATGHHVLALPKTSMNIGDRASVIHAIDGATPDVLVNAAGDKNLQHCEEDSVRAMQLNAYAAAMVAGVCGERGVKFVQIGSDHGYGTPETAYSASKLAGDEMVMHANPKALIAVTGHVYAMDCPWIRWLDGELRAERTVEAWADIFNWPTYAPNLAAMILELLEVDYAGRANCCGRQRVNRLELFKIYATAAGLDASLVVPCPTPCPSALHPRNIWMPQRHPTVAMSVQAGMTAMFQSALEGVAA